MRGFGVVFTPLRRLQKETPGIKRKITVHPHLMPATTKKIATPEDEELADGFEVSNCPPFVTVATCAANFALSAAKPLPLSPNLDSDLDVNRDLSIKLLHTQLRVLLGIRLEVHGEIVQPLNLDLASSSNCDIYMRQF